MKKKLFKTMIIAMTIALATPITANAEEEEFGGGMSRKITIVEEVEEPAPEPEPQHEEPAPEPEPEPQHEEPAPEPEPQHEEPAPEPEPQHEEPAPEPEPTPQPQPTPEPEPTPQPQPTPEPQQEEKQEPKKEEQKPSNNEPTGNIESEPVKTQNNQTVDKAPAAQPAADATPVKKESNAASKKAEKVEATPKAEKKPAVVVQPVVEDEPVIAVEEPVIELPEGEEVLEQNNDDLSWLLKMLCFLLAIVFFAILLLFLLRKKYVVIKVMKNRDGEEEEIEVKKFRNIEKAAKFVAEYDWRRNDISLVINNITRKNEARCIDGEIENVNRQLVYFTSDERDYIGFYADEHEIDVIEETFGGDAECEEN